MGRPKKVEVESTQQVEKALGIHHNREKGTFEIVVFEFSGDVATIVDRKYVGIDKVVAISKFKQMAVELGVVR